MKRKWVIILVVTLVLCFTLMACIKQTLHRDVAFIERHSYESVFQASIRAVEDIGFTIHSMDRDTGFIGAESGPFIGDDMPPRLSILISQERERVFVDCKLLRPDEFVDIFGHGRRTVNDFLLALNIQLNH